MTNCRKQTPVFCAVERGGQLRRRVVADVTAATLQTAIREEVDSRARLMTDEYSAYRGLKKTWEGVRTCLALTRKPFFQKRALDNMRAGGKYKGWANLPEVQNIEVRQEVANVAGVSARTVTNVETLLKLAHPRLRQALQEATLTINRALQFCRLPRAEQLEQFILYSEEHATNKVIRQIIVRPREEKASPHIVTVLNSLQRQELQQPGSVVVKFGRNQRTVILVGRDLLSEPDSQLKET